MPFGNHCPVCKSCDTKTFIELNDMPANIAVLWENRMSAINCRKGQITLVLCRSCGMVWNMDFDSSILEYSQAYDNSLHFSTVYQNYAISQAKHLIERYNIKNKTVIDVGCGKGDFLMMLCDIGQNRGVGFDVSYESREIKDELANRITFVNDFYTEKYHHYGGDLVCSRYVLEHIDKPIDFMASICRSIGDRLNTVVYFEVPNIYLILEKMSVWDIIYEHCLYFSPGSLANLFEACGFEVKDVSETYDTQFITIEAILADPIHACTKYDKTIDLGRIVQNVESFSLEYNDQVQSWSKKVRQYQQQNKKMMAWGAGAKGVGFMNLLKVDDTIPYIVDINPHKHGRFVAGTGQEIVPPDFVKSYQPDVIIIMNPIYKDEITDKINQMGIDAEIMTV